MEVLLSKVTQQAMNHAIRCGITITGGFAIRQCSRLLRTVKANEKERGEIASLQHRLEAKIRIISPAIDMIELIAARGNTSLESAVTLTKQIRWGIQSLGVRLAHAVAGEEAQRRGSSRASTMTQDQHELRAIITDMSDLLEKIEDAVPLINLAITTSGVNLSTTLPSTVSPSRLLQASTFLTSGDTRYAMAPGQPVQVGPVFTLSMYMLFSAHAFRPHDENAVRETTWKEVIHKARLKLLRVPLDNIKHLPGDGISSASHKAVHKTRNGTGESKQGVPSEGKAFEFAYQLLIIEDLDDDRVHTFEDDEAQPTSFGDVALAGIREVLPMHEISKIFYADTGKILNIGTDGEVNNPVLLLKRDANAIPPRRMMNASHDGQLWDSDEDDGEDDAGDAESVERADSNASRSSPRVAEEEAEEKAQGRPWSLPPNLDPEWIAFEVYTEAPDSEEDEDDDEEPAAPSPCGPRPARSSRSSSFDPSFTAALSNLQLDGNIASSPPPMQSMQLIKAASSTAPATLYATSTAPTSLPALRTSLSLLELLIRLTSLQQFQQLSHLAITDELLNFFLSEAGSTGAGGDAQIRQRVRREARERVGFDPYDESPIKRRGEEYLEHYASGTQYDGTDAGAQDGRSTPISPQYSPRLAGNYAQFSRRPSGSSAVSRGSRKPHTSKILGNSPAMSSPLARKAGSHVPDLRNAAAGRAVIGKSALSRSESDSTLGTSPNSAEARRWLPSH